MSGTINSRTLIDYLRRLRQAKGKSAQDVANATGIPRSTIANLETGRRASISVDEAAAMCDALGVDLRVALTDEHELHRTSESSWTHGQAPRLLRSDASCVCGWRRPAEELSFEEIIALHDQEVS